MKNKEIIEAEIVDYVNTRTRKNRGEIIDIELKTYEDYVTDGTVVNKDCIVGGFVTFTNGDRIFVYRFEGDHVAPDLLAAGYRSYSGYYNSEKMVKEVVIGWNNERIRMLSKMKA